MKLLQIIAISLFCFLSISTQVVAKNPLLSKSTPQILPPDQAFILFAEITPTQMIKLEWQIAPNHYLYRDKFKFTSPDNDQIEFHYDLPIGDIISDPNFGEQVVYRDLLSISLKTNETGNQRDQYFTVHYQGCSDSGFCYPPQAESFKFKWKEGRLVELELINFNTAESDIQPAFTTSEDKVTFWFNQLGPQWQWLGFYFFGLLLAFTPCVLPMIPILSGIIAGPALNHNPGRAFRLTLTYVLSIALTYAAAGIITAKLGASLQGTLQRPLYIALFSALFIYLGLSQLGYAPLRLPHRIQHHLNILHHRQSSGTYAGAFALGILATLLASPCVSAPLVGALTLIAQSGDISMGALNLFMMGLGMGTLLLVVGSVGSQLLPKTGAWMTRVNQLIAFMLFGLSIWMLARILPASWILASWGILAIIGAYFLGAFSLKQKGWSPRIGTLLLIYGVILVIGGSRGHTDLLTPLNSKFWESNHSKEQNVPFEATVHSIEELNSTLEHTKSIKKPALLYFYATWCVSCVKIEKDLYPHPALKPLLSEFYLIKADVTDFNADAKALMQQYNVIAPPSFIFLSSSGNENGNYRLIGEISLIDFKQHLESFLRGSNQN
ncbi:MAG: protein-disulfide reductase DsbD [Gammaproteobacteria bacterium]